MKELSIEEKAKRYDEVLKVLHKYDGANIMFSQSLKEEMFPELKESEDEKTKRILHSISNKMSQHLCDIFTEEDFQCFDAWSNAWLKKQGERESVVVIPKFRVGDVIRLKGSTAEYTIESISGECYHGRGWGLHISCDNDYELVEQKPAWSEEDEDVINLILSICSDFKNSFSGHVGAAVEDDIKKIDKWLKSLRPQTTWKPSKEQITVLHDVAAYIDNSIYPNQKDILVNLYLQLKKLMED